MEWLLGISVVFNVLLALLAGFLMVLKVGAENETFHAREEWGKWERRFYEAQGTLLEEWDLYVSHTRGAYGKMLIEHNSKGRINIED
jgi:hypothetical protein